MWRLAELRVDPSLLARLRCVVFVFFIFIPASAHAIDDVKQAPDYATAQIWLTPANSSRPISFSVKLAVTSSQHAYGLMFSQPLPAKSGMLFLFKDMKPRTFWMKNTPIALDMLFFDDSGRLVTLISNAKPNTMTLLHSRVAARYVLEIGGLEASRLKIKIGSRLHLPISITGNEPLSRKK